MQIYFSVPFVKLNISNFVSEYISYNKNSKNSIGLFDIFNIIQYNVVIIIDLYLIVVENDYL